MAHFHLLMAHFHLRLFCLALVGTLSMVLANPASAQSAKKTTPKANASKLVQKALPPEFMEMLPIGRDLKGVVIPSYDDVVLKSVLNADIIRRISDADLDLEKLVIHVYNGKKEPDTTIAMDRAIFNITSGILTSQTPAEVEQEKFTMNGDQLIYDTNSQISEMSGNVRVVIPNASNVVPPFGKSGKSGKSKTEETQEKDP